MSEVPAKQMLLRKQGRQQYIAGALAGLVLNAGLLWLLVTRESGSHGARVAAWVLVPAFTVACAVIAFESWRRKPEDSFFDLFDTKTDDAKGPRGN
jgi:Na+-driven multidrug efflux pump